MSEKDYKYCYLIGKTSEITQRVSARIREAIHMTSGCARSHIKTHIPHPQLSQEPSLAPSPEKHHLWQK
jgi:hypothetical protein